MTKIVAKDSGPAARRARRRHRRQQGSGGSVENATGSSTEALVPKQTVDETQESKDAKDSPSDIPLSPTSEPNTTPKTPDVSDLPLTQPTLPQEHLLDMPDSIASDPNLFPLDSAALETDLLDSTSTEPTTKTSEPATPELLPEASLSEPTTPSPLSRHSTSSSLRGIAPQSIRASIDSQASTSSSPAADKNPEPQSRLFPRLAGLASWKGKDKIAKADSGEAKATLSSIPRPRPRPTSIGKGASRVSKRTAETKWLHQQCAASRIPIAKRPNTCPHGMDKEECDIERRKRKQQARDKEKIEREGGDAEGGANWMVDKNEKQARDATGRKDRGAHDQREPTKGVFKDEDTQGSDLKRKGKGQKQAEVQEEESDEWTVV